MFPESHAVTTACRRTKLCIDTFPSFRFDAESPKIAVVVESVLTCTREFSAEQPQHTPCAGVAATWCADRGPGWSSKHITPFILLGDISVHVLVESDSFTVEVLAAEEV